MQQQKDIVFLKPTNAFLFFLKSQLPEEALPDLEILETDLTAYTLPARLSNKAVIDFLESHASNMFEYEAARWLGYEASKQIRVSHLEFLCCFKFEFHSHIMLLEPDVLSAKHLLRLRPTPALFELVLGQCMSCDKPAFRTIFNENTTIIVKNFSCLEEITPFLKQYYEHIFEMETARVGTITDSWPAISSFETFRRYFKVDVHTTLIHLT